MRSREIISLPLAPAEYNARDEQVMRRTVEQSVSDLRSDIIRVRDQEGVLSSSSMRRHQFLLMGAS